MLVGLEVKALLQYQQISFQQKIKPEHAIHDSDSQMTTGSCQTGHGEFATT